MYIYTNRQCYCIIHIIDIDECQVNNGNCSHHCKNTPGSYYCHCNHGYELQPDKLSCQGNS